MKFIKRNRKLIQNTSIIVVLLLVAISEVMIYIHSQRFVIQGDQFFHINYLNGLSKAIRNGHLLPHINIWSLNQNGNAEFTMYPYLTSLPIAIIFAFLKWGITSQYIILDLYIFTGLIISYYAGKSEIKSKYRRILFALIFDTSCTLFTDGFVRNDLGEFIAYLLLPLVFFGALQLIHKGKWHELACGLILIAYTHIITLVLASVFVVTMIILNGDKIIKKHNIVPLIKCILISIIISAYQLEPIMYMIVNNKTNVPEVLSVSQIKAKPILINVIYFIGLIGIICTLDGIINFKHLNRIGKQLIIINILLIITQTSLMPWHTLIGCKLLDILQLPQMPQRLIMFIDITSAYVVSKYLGQYKHLRVKIISLIVIALIYQWGIQNQYNIGNLRLTKQFNLTAPIYGKDNMDMKYRRSGHGNMVKLNAYMNKNNQIKYITDYTYPNNIYNDYYTKVSNKSNIRYLINLQEDKENGIKFKKQGNGKFKFSNNRHLNTITLPVDDYRGINYQTILNGKRVPNRRNKQELLTVNSAKSGNNYVQVKPEDNKNYEISGYISLIAAIVVIAKYIRDRKMRR